MRKKKQSSQSLERANTRAAALASIDPALDLGNEITLAAYKAALSNTRGLMDTYNTLLSQVDEASSRFKQSEKALNDWTDRMLAAVAARFGRESDEYEKAGGTRKSERRRPATNKSRTTAQVN
jgi:hypothetical protein